MEILSIKDITKRFNLYSKTQSEIIEELKGLRAGLHPDKNGGVFKSDEDKKVYHDIVDALNWLEKTNALVPLSQLTDLVKVLKDLDKPKEKDELTKLESDLSARLDKAKTSITKSFQFPKIAVSSLTGVVSFIWLFPKQLSEQPILRYYADSIYFSQAWFLLLTSTIYLWVFNYIIELKQTNFNKKIETDSYQTEVFKRFIKEQLIKKSDSYAIEGFIIFTKAQLVNFLGRNLHTKLIKRPIEAILAFYSLGLSLAKPKIDVESMEKLADLILKKNLTKGILQIVDIRSIDDTYQTNIDEREMNNLIND